jgi:hypothetical protein
LVAVIFPNVAVKLVPAVIVVPAEIDPAEAAIFPSVAVILPAETTAFPVVTVNPVPAVIVVVEATVVVATIDPGAIKAAGILKVIVVPDPDDVIWDAVPNKLILPAADGDKAPPLPPVSV